MKSNATNSAGMKSSNRRLILSIIQKRPTSRAELARLTGLTRAAVTLIVDELIKKEILVETGTAEADYGRKPVLLDLNPRSFFAIGVSITREGCNIGAMNIKGELLEKRQVKLDAAFDAHGNIGVITGEVKKLITELALPHEKLLGVGINTPGPVDINHGRILNPPNFHLWHNIGIVNEFKKSFAFDVFVENNATALAIAEKNYGRGAGFQSFMLLVVDSGIGAGIIINDNIYRGVGGFGSEVGHASVDINGKECNCGNRGCLEVYASIPAVIDGIKSCDSSITSWNLLVDRALSGDEPCRRAIEKEAAYLSTGIVNAMNILELEAVILTGDIQYKPETLLDSIREKVENSLLTRHLRELDIMVSSITRDSDIISSASILFEKYFRGELEKKLNEMILLNHLTEAYLWEYN